MALSHQQLLEIGESAAKDVIGNVRAVDVSSGYDSEGNSAYFFELSLEQDRDRARATLLRTRLRQKIRDLLIAERDSKYPYVRILGDRA